MNRKNTQLGIIWILLFSFLVLTPILILILGPKFGERPPILDFSVGLGFVGMAIMALQFIISGRIKIFNRPFGTDLIYHFHRQIGIAAFFMVFTHPLLLFIIDKRYLRLLNLITAPWRARAAVTSIVLLIIVIFTAEYREKLKISYKVWKLWHGIFSTVMVGLALVHIFLAGRYTDLPWKRALWIGYSILFLGLLVWTRIIYPLRLMRRSFRVKATKEEQGDVRTIILEPINHKGFQFLPGQFAWLTAWNTPFSDTEHPFSIASSAEKKHEIEMSIKNLGPFTKKIRSLKSGDRVYVDGPYGSFSLDRISDNERLILIPGGIGVTPIMSMLCTMADRSDKRPILLFYCNREWETVTFKDEIKGLENKLNVKTIYTIEKPPENWKGESGFLNKEILMRHIPEKWFSEGTDVFLCGPTPMMNAVEGELQKIGFKDSQIHTEKYSFA